MKETFKEYLEALKNEDSIKSPKTDFERGMRAAIHLIYEHYKK